MRIQLFSIKSDIKEICKNAKLCSSSLDFAAFVVLETIVYFHKNVLYVNM